MLNMAGVVGMLLPCDACGMLATKAPEPMATFLIKDLLLVDIIVDL